MEVSLYVKNASFVRLDYTLLYQGGIAFGEQKQQKSAFNDHVDCHGNQPDVTSGVSL
ncbi:protein of unknown function [Paenibacillus alvei]|uniref:Uncharacterized protein n=1 Tax=Paenibacillus alvei TaxID=44250 RepID=A0A383RKT0_PAEAL|nr:protein of unknown function [Paenibacillus alvei]